MSAPSTTAKPSAAAACDEQKHVQPQQKETEALSPTSRRRLPNANTNNTNNNASGQSSAAAAASGATTTTKTTTTTAPTTLRIKLLRQSDPKRPLLGSAAAAALSSSNRQQNQIQQPLQQSGGATSAKKPRNNKHEGAGVGAGAPTPPYVYVSKEMARKVGERGGGAAGKDASIGGAYASPPPPPPPAYTSSDAASLLSPLANTAGAPVVVSVTTSTRRAPSPPNAPDSLVTTTTTHSSSHHHHRASSAAHPSVSHPVAVASPAASLASTQATAATFFEDRDNKKGNAKKQLQPRKQQGAINMSAAVPAAVITPRSPSSSAAALQSAAAAAVTKIIPTSAGTAVPFVSIARVPHSPPAKAKATACGGSGGPQIPSSSSVYHGGSFSNQSISIGGVRIFTSPPPPPPTALPQSSSTCTVSESGINIYSTEAGGTATAGAVPLPLPPFAAVSAPPSTVADVATAAQLFDVASGDGGCFGGVASTSKEKCQPPLLPTIALEEVNTTNANPSSSITAAVSSDETQRRSVVPQLLRAPTSVGRVSAAETIGALKVVPSAASSPCPSPSASFLPYRSPPVGPFLSQPLSVRVGSVLMPSAIPSPAAATMMMSCAAIARPQIPQHGGGGVGVVVGSGPNALHCGFDPRGGTLSPPPPLPPPAPSAYFLTQSQGAEEAFLAETSHAERGGRSPRGASRSSSSCVSGASSAYVCGLGNTPSAPVPRPSAGNTVVLAQSQSSSSTSAAAARRAACLSTIRARLEGALGRALQTAAVNAASAAKSNHSVHCRDNCCNNRIALTSTNAPPSAAEVPSSTSICDDCHCEEKNSREVHVTVPLADLSRIAGLADAEPAVHPTHVGSSSSAAAASAPSDVDGANSSVLVGILSMVPSTLGKVLEAAAAAAAVSGVGTSANHQQQQRRHHGPASSKVSSGLARLVAAAVKAREMTAAAVKGLHVAPRGNTPPPVASGDISRNEEEQSTLLTRSRPSNSVHISVIVSITGLSLSNNPDITFAALAAFLGALRAEQQHHQILSENSEKSIEIGTFKLPPSSSSFRAPPPSTSSPPSVSLRVPPSSASSVTFSVTLAPMAATLTTLELFDVGSGNDEHRRLIASSSSLPSSSRPAGSAVRNVCRNGRHSISLPPLALSGAESATTTTSASSSVSSSSLMCNKKTFPPPHYAAAVATQLQSVVLPQTPLKPAMCDDMMPLLRSVLALGSTSVGSHDSFDDDAPDDAQTEGKDDSKGVHDSSLANASSSSPSSRAPRTDTRIGIRQLKIGDNFLITAAGVEALLLGGEVAKKDEQPPALSIPYHLHSFESSSPMAEGGKGETPQAAEAFDGITTVNSAAAADGVGWPSGLSHLHLGGCRSLGDAGAAAIAKALLTTTVGSGEVSQAQKESLALSNQCEDGQELPSGGERSAQQQRQFAAAVGLRSLQLRGIGLTAAGAEALADAVSRFCGCCSSSSSLPDKRDGTASTIEEAVEGRDDEKRVRRKGWSLTSTTSSHRCRFPLRDLQVRENPLGPAGISALAQLVGHCPTLRMLDAAYCSTDYGGGTTACNSLVVAGGVDEAATTKEAQQQQQQQQQGAFASLLRTLHEFCRPLPTTTTHAVSSSAQPATPAAFSSPSSHSSPLHLWSHLHANAYSHGTLRELDLSGNPIGGGATTNSEAHASAAGDGVRSGPSEPSEAIEALLPLLTVRVVKTRLHDGVRNGGGGESNAANVHTCGPDDDSANAVLLPPPPPPASSSSTAVLLFSSLSILDLTNASLTAADAAAIFECIGRPFPKAERRRLLQHLVPLSSSAAHRLCGATFSSVACPSASSGGDGRCFAAAGKAALSLLLKEGRRMHPPSSLNHLIMGSNAIGLEKDDERGSDVVAPWDCSDEEDSFLGTDGGSGTDDNSSDNDETEIDATATGGLVAASASSFNKREEPSREEMRMRAPMPVDADPSPSPTPPPHASSSESKKPFSEGLANDGGPAIGSNKPAATDDTNRRDEKGNVREAAVAVPLPTGRPVVDRSAATNADFAFSFAHSLLQSDDDDENEGVESDSGGRRRSGEDGRLINSGQVHAVGDADDECNQLRSAAADAPLPSFECDEEEKNHLNGSESATSAGRPSDGTTTSTAVAAPTSRRSPTLDPAFAQSLAATTVTASTTNTNTNHTSSEALSAHSTRNVSAAGGTDGGASHLASSSPAGPADDERELKEDEDEAEAEALLAALAAEEGAANADTKEENLGAKLSDSFLGDMLRAEEKEWAAAPPAVCSNGLPVMTTGGGEDYRHSPFVLAYPPPPQGVAAPLPLQGSEHLHYMYQQQQQYMHMYVHQSQALLFTSTAAAAAAVPSPLGTPPLFAGSPIHSRSHSLLFAAGDTSDTIPFCNSPIQQQPHQQRAASSLPSYCDALGAKMNSGSIGSCRGNTAVPFGGNGRPFSVPPAPSPASSISPPSLSFVCDDGLSTAAHAPLPNAAEGASSFSHASPHLPPAAARLRLARGSPPLPTSSSSTAASDCRAPHAADASVIVRRPQISDGKHDDDDHGDEIPSKCQRSGRPFVAERAPPPHHRLRRAFAIALRSRSCRLSSLLVPNCCLGPADIRALCAALTPTMMAHGDNDDGDGPASTSALQNEGRCSQSSLFCDCSKESPISSSAAATDAADPREGEGETSDDERHHTTMIGGSSSSSPHATAAASAGGGGRVVSRCAHPVHPLRHLAFHKNNATSTSADAIAAMLRACGPPLLLPLRAATTAHSPHTQRDDDATPPRPFPAASAPSAFASLGLTKVELQDNSIASYAAMRGLIVGQGLLRGVVGGGDTSFSKSPSAPSSAGAKSTIRLLRFGGQSASKANASDAPLRAIVSAATSSGGGGGGGGAHIVRSPPDVSQHQH